MDLQKYIDDSKKIVESTFTKYIDKNKDLYPKLKESMTYSFMAGGKRLRPALMFLCYELSGKDKKDIAAAACSIEMIHSYSLIHDDLPAMDDDDLRRGKPTNHKVFGEGMAILAGDALLTDAFNLFLSINNKAKNENKIKALQILSLRAGSVGMVGGQAVDLEYENFNLKIKSKKKMEKILNYIHQHKTADMIMASCEIGSILSGDIENQKNISLFAQKIGLCFQIVDDILDVIADKKKLGKSGSDSKNKKLTFVSLYGLQKAKDIADKVYKEAFFALKKIKGKREKLDLLKEMTEFILRRDF